MGYRRNTEAALRWKRWREAQAELILASGIPAEAVANEDAWWDYLEHETSVPTEDAAGRPYTQEQIIALRQLVRSWPGGTETMIAHCLGLR